MTCMYEDATQLCNDTCPGWKECSKHWDRANDIDDYEEIEVRQLDEEEEE